MKQHTTRKNWTRRQIKKSQHIEKAEWTNTAERIKQMKLTKQYEWKTTAE